MLTGKTTLSEVGIDAVALKPTESDLRRATDLPVDALAIDYEGRDALPDEATLGALSSEFDLLVTTPVRADGFDPLGDDSLVSAIPEATRRVLVAGHPAYLTDEEQNRSIASRLGAALEISPNAWVGTEGIERIAMAAGSTQYELLSRRTDHAVESMRAAGFDDPIAVYAPTVLTDDEDAVLDAVGEYAARRAPVRQALPEGASTDSKATGRARDVLSAAVRDYALVGSPSEVRQRVDSLREAGVTTVVGYPARGLDPVLE